MALTGAGTESNPFLIGTVADLKQIPSYQGIGKNFKMTADIDLNGATGFPLSGFQGIFDGDKHTLKSLYVSQSTLVDAGLWSYIDNATIKNVALQSFNIMGEARVGALAGESYANCVIENVYTTGTTFIQTYAPTGTLSKWSYAGGLIGFANNPVTYRNVAVRSAVVKAYSYTGVFQGYGNGSTFDQCYSYPLAGNIYAKTGGYGAFTASQNTVADASTSYYVDTGSTPQGATLVTDADLKNQSKLTKFDFNTRWGIDSTINGGYATPKVFLPVLEPPKIFTVHKVSYIKSLASQIAWVNVVHPLIKAIHINSHIQPLSTAYSISVMEVVDKHIKAISKLNNVSTEVKRLQLEKAISDIVSHLNQITGHLVITKDIKPFVFDNLVSLLESGNDISFMQYLINEIYINESRHLTTNLQSKTEVTVVAFTGDTVTLKVNFKTYDNVAIEPTDVKVKIYKPTSTTYELISTISLSEANKTGIGQYEYLYTVPENLLTNSSTNFLVYEFSGLYNGQATLARGKFSIRFV